ncbi:signal recognition particle 9 kDa protein-domain-containing protein [Hypomontagnella monticulosa]|nr:signal recognition particle 9 kDa protein-domain-containing protein [Hypomontagnella monticulosa]
MPYYATSQEWLRQSSLLLEARPTTTRITTKYHIAKPKPRRNKKSSDSTTTSEPTTTAATAAPRGSLTLKTYDPHSGVCLKYRTTKAAEVSRLILSLGRPLGTRMAALPVPEDADEVMADVAVEEKEEKGKEPATSSGKAQVPAAVAGSGKTPAQGQAQQQGGGGGGKGKKKRGKK